MTEQSFFTHLVSCEGGLNTQSSALTLGRAQFNGFARRLINFEPWRGYRRITGVTQFGGVTGFAAGSRNTRGVAVFNNKIMAAREDAAGTYCIYEQSITGSLWTSLSGGLTIASTGKVRNCKIGFSGAKIVFVDGTGPARAYDGTNFVTLNGGGAPDNPSIVATFKNRLVLGGYSATPYKITISAPNDETNYAGASGAIEINVGDVVTGVRQFRDELIIFCENSIRKIMGDTSANFTLLPITLNLGCVATDSIFEMDARLYFWCADGLRQLSATDRIDDTELGGITNLIQHTVDDLLTAGQDPRKIVTSVIQRKTQFRVFFSNSATTEASARGILGGMVQDPINKASHMELGELLGINPSCTDSGFINGVEYNMYGGWDGKVYQQELGNDIHGSPIQAVYLSPFMDLSDPFVRKSLYRLIHYTEVEGNVTYYTRLHFDFDDDTIINPVNVMTSLTFDESTYGDAGSTYGTATYGGNNFPAVLQNCEGSCKTVSIGIVSVDSQPSFHIMGFGIEHSLEGRA